MDIKNSVLENTRCNQLNWYGHMRRMNEEGQRKKKKL